ncbi:MAG TPA: extracellular solute-binding protein [Clostridia bacterium]|nr:extracellular solute-binding protein [Clostridia bacterium]
MRRNRVFQALLLSMAIVFLTGACTQAPDKTKTAAFKKQTDGVEKTTLRFISSWGGVDSKAETLKTVLNQFEKNNTDITIVNESLFGEDFLPKIKTDFASGNDPDVFGLWPGSDINMLIKAGKVYDLTDQLSKAPAWKKSFNQGMWGYTTQNGRIYGLPFEVIFECMFVNRDIFIRYGVPFPKNFEQLKAAVQIFKKNNITPIAFNTYAEGTYFYQNLIAVMGGKDGAENPFVGNAIRQSHIIALQYIKELYDMGAFPEDCFTITNNQRNVLFKEKKAAMIVQGSWFIGEFDPSDTSVDMIPFPYPEGYESHWGTMVYGLGGGTFHMSTVAGEDSTKLDASLRLLKYLTSPETAAVFASETGMISNVNIDRFNINYMELAVKGNQLVERAPYLVGPLDHFVDRAAWEEDIAKQFPYFLSGKITAEEMWSNAIRNGIIPN